VSLDQWLETVRERPQVSFALELRRMLEAVSRTAVTAAEAEERDRVVAAVGASIAAQGESPMAAANRVLADWRRLAQDAKAAAAVVGLCSATHLAGGRSTSAADCRRVIDAASGASGTRLLGSGAVLLALAPVALFGIALHAVPFALSRSTSKRFSETASDRAARTIVPGLYLMFVWYAMLALVLAMLLGSFPASGSSPVAWPIVLAAVAAFTLLLPRLGDLAVAWRRDLRAVRLERRVRSMSDDERAAIRDSFTTLHAAHVAHVAHAASVSHRPGPAVSVLA
jgi:hypothetical protein